MKKKLLISSNSITLVQLFGPIIPKLSKEFRIVVALGVLKDVQTPRNVNDLIDGWETDGVIEKHFLIPDPKNKLKFNLTMWEIVPRLKAYGFDLWLTRSDMQPSDRYIFDFVLPERSIRIVMSPLMTYLFQRHQEIAKKMLSDAEKIVPGPLATNTTGSNTNLLGFVLRKIKQDSPFELLRKVWVYLTSWTIKKISIYQSYLIDRMIFPWLITRKTFRYEPYDQMTQMSSGRSDAYIMCDEVEVEAHKILFKTPNVYLARYPTLDNCRCADDTRKKTTILCPLSGWERGDSIPEDIMALYYRDFRSVIEKTGATNCHLRRHPGFRPNGGWGNQLQEYLTRRGITCEVVGCERPITEIACDYLGVVGCASSALRDIRAYCNLVFVVGLVGVSKPYFSDPKFIFGKSEGIGWIEEDGSYDPNILARRQYVQSAQKDISEIVIELARAQKDALQ